MDGYDWEQNYDPNFDGDGPRRRKNPWPILILALIPVCTVVFLMARAARSAHPAPQSVPTAAQPGVLPTAGPPTEAPVQIDSTETPVEAAPPTKAPTDAEPTTRPTPTRVAPTLEISPRPGYQAPDFTLTTLDGQAVTLSELRGSPVVILFWATWCPYCRNELPAAQQVYEECQQSDLILLAVTAGNKDEVSEIEALAEKHNLTFPILLDSQDEFAQLYQANSLPTHFFVRADGQIQDVLIGSLSKAEYQSKIDELLQAYE